MKEGRKEVPTREEGTERKGWTGTPVRNPYPSHYRICLLATEPNGVIPSSRGLLNPHPPAVLMGNSVVGAPGGLSSPSKWGRDRVRNSLVKTCWGLGNFAPVLRRKPCTSAFKCRKNQTCLMTYFFPHPLENENYPQMVGFSLLTLG